MFTNVAQSAIYAFMVLLSLNIQVSRAQGSKPVPKFIDRAETLRLCWNDAPNHFKSVRATKPHDNDPDIAVYDLLTVPQGSSVWLDDFYNAQVSVKQAKSDIRNGQPQTKLGLFFAKIPNRKEAENLFNQMKGVVASLPGAMRMRYLLSNRLPGWIRPVRRRPSIETIATGPRVNPSPTRSGSSAMMSATVKVATP